MTASGPALCCLAAAAAPVLAGLHLCIRLCAFPASQLRLPAAASRQCTASGCTWGLFQQRWRRPLCATSVSSGSRSAVGGPAGGRWGPRRLERCRVQATLHASSSCLVLRPLARRARCAGMEGSMLNLPRLGLDKDDSLLEQVGAAGLGWSGCRRICSLSHASICFMSWTKRSRVLACAAQRHPALCPAGGAA